MQFGPHELSYLLQSIANGVASVGLLLLIIYAMAFSVRFMAGRKPALNLTVVKVGIVMGLLGSAASQLVLMCDPGLGAALLRQQADALISQAARVEYHGLAYSASRAVGLGVNLLLAAAVLAVVAAFQKPGRGFGRQWPTVARMADRLAAYARRKADEGGHVEGGGDAPAGLRPDAATA